MECGDGILKIEDGILKIEDGILKIEDGILKIEDGILKIEDGILKIEDGIFLSSGFGDFRSAFACVKKYSCLQSTKLVTPVSTN